MMDGRMDGRTDGLRPSFGVLKKWASLQLYLFPPPAAEDASPETSVFYCLSVMCCIFLLSYISSLRLQTAVYVKEINIKV